MSDISWDDICQGVNVAALSSSANITEKYETAAQSVLSARDYKHCVRCGGVLTLKDNYTICNSCGIEDRDNVIEGDMVNCCDMTSVDGSNANYFGNNITLKITGKGSYGLQKSVLKNCANYERYRASNNLKEMRNLNAQNAEVNIPRNIIREANEMFTKIHDAGYVFRKDQKKGVISACLYYACFKNGIARTPQEIAKFMQIEEKFHSHGDRVLHDLNEKEIINIPIQIMPMRQYLEMYFNLLDINRKFLPFTEALINKAERSTLHILHDCKNNTKCIGAIYMLVTRIPMLSQRISLEYISNTCSISPATVKRYFNVIETYWQHFKVVFKRYGIPMPVAWRGGVIKSN